MRHIPAAGNWFSGDDDLAGSLTIPTPQVTYAAQQAGGDTEWTKLFGAFDEYVISTGDRLEWMRFTKAELGTQGDYASQNLATGITRTVLQSHLSPEGTSTVYWLWRDGQTMDPFISYGTHTDGKILYGEAGNSYNLDALASAQLGINVFVRLGPFVPAACTDSLPTGFDDTRTDGCYVVRASTSGGSTVTESTCGSDSNYFYIKQECILRLGYDTSNNEDIIVDHYRGSTLQTFQLGSTNTFVSGFKYWWTLDKTDWFAGNTDYLLQAQFKFTHDGTTYESSVVRPNDFFVIPQCDSGTHTCS